MYCEIISAARERHIYGKSIRREIPEFRIDKPDAFHTLCPKNIPELTLHRPIFFISDVIHTAYLTFHFRKSFARACHIALLDAMAFYGADMRSHR